MKIRTTTREFKAQIQEHIISCLSDDEFTTVEEQLQDVVNQFGDWYSPYERKMNPNRQEAFTAWLLCLPSCMTMEFTHYGIYTTLKAWFENLGGEYKEQDSDKEQSLYYGLVFREFRYVCKKYNVDFPMFI